MKSRLSIGKVAGISIQIHWTFLFIIGWAIYIGWRQGGNVEAMIWSTIFVLCIFVCVVLHELGHALTAKKFDINTRRITLLPIGGVASLERMPEKPQQELIVAVMGPAVNVFIAMVLYPFIRSQLKVFNDTESLETFFQTVTPDNFLLFLFLTNLALVIFNLIPAFPMDGGRVLRSLLSFKLDRVHATQIAANLGQIIAIVFLFLGFAFNPILIFISLFVFLGATGEYTMVKQMSMLKGHQVSAAMMTNYTTFKPQDSLEEVGETLIAGTERQFIVLDNENEIVGILYHNRIIEAFRNNRKDLPVSAIMNDDFITVEQAADLGEIYRTVQGNKQNFFPVLNEGKLAGVIDMENINEFLMLQANFDY